jgi:hypothetical protein
MVFIIARATFGGLVLIPSRAGNFFVNRTGLNVLKDNDILWFRIKYDPEIHHRKSIHLRGYDYSQAGA